MGKFSSCENDFGSLVWPSRGKSNRCVNKKVQVKSICVSQKTTCLPAESDDGTEVNIALVVCVSLHQW